MQRRCCSGWRSGSPNSSVRYRDRPTAPLSTVSGWIYIVVNGLTAGLALWLIRVQGVAAKTMVFDPAVAQVLLAGFGTMAFFRTSLFTVRVGEADVDRVRHHHLRPAHHRRHAGWRRSHPPPSRGSCTTCLSWIGI
jgi:hypothetical protein